MVRTKNFLLFILIAALTISSLRLAGCAWPPPIPKPQSPQFNVYLVNHPYYVPPTTPTYTTDPYNGEQKMTNPGSAGYQVDNITIELWILNQQPNYSNGTLTYTPYYDVRTKGHFEENWTELYPPSQSSHYANYLPDMKTDYILDITPIQSELTYTVITYSSTYPPYYNSQQYSPNATVDFQVSTLIGYPSKVFVSDHMAPMDYIGHYEPATGFYKQSDWTSTQSITISNNSVLSSTLDNPIKPEAIPIPIPTDTPPPPTPTPAPTPTPTPTPTVKPYTNMPSFVLSLDFQVIVVLVVAVTALLLAILSLILRKRRKIT